MTKDIYQCSGQKSVSHPSQLSQHNSLLHRMYNNLLNFSTKMAFSTAVVIAVSFAVVIVAVAVQSRCTPLTTTASDGATEEEPPTTSSPPLNSNGLINDQHDEDRKRLITNLQELINERVNSLSTLLDIPMSTFTKTNSTEENESQAMIVNAVNTTCYLYNMYTALKQQHLSANSQNVPVVRIIMEKNIEDLCEWLKEKIITEVSSNSTTVSQLSCWINNVNKTSSQCSSDEAQNSTLKKECMMPKVVTVKDVCKHWNTLRLYTKVFNIIPTVEQFL